VRSCPGDRAAAGSPHLPGAGDVPGPCRLRPRRRTFPHRHAVTEDPAGSSGV